MEVIDSVSGYSLWTSELPRDMHISKDDWNDGDIYKYLLRRLNADGVIVLPAGEPVI